MGIELPICKVKMLKRLHLNKVSHLLEIAPICAILGPRQCGKTTLARAYAANYQNVHFFDLEDEIHLAKLANPQAIFQNCDGLIVIDEIQLRPDLFKILRVIVDNSNKKFLILGSASQDLIRQSSETLAGRIMYLEMTPFSLPETHDLQVLWARGGFPRSFLASSKSNSYEWRQSYIKTFLERDIASFGFNIPPQAMRRFWTMLAHYHGQIFNASEIGNSMQLDRKTIVHYLDILVGTFMVRRLSPWFENISKRQIKSPKIYFRDSGLLHNMLGIKDMDELIMHPKLGFSWEGFAVEEIIRHMNVDSEDCYFWGTQSGEELDLLVLKDGKKIGFEFKYTDSPKITKSMQIAMEDLKLDELNVIIPHAEKFALSEKVNVFGVEEFIFVDNKVKNM